MNTRIQKWGNSLAVRIPKSFAAEVRLESGASIDLSLNEGRIILQPHPQPSYRLADLLRGVTKRNRHSEVDTGMPLGREAW